MSTANKAKRVISQLLGESDDLTTWKLVFNVERYADSKAPPIRPLVLTVSGATEESAIKHAGSSTAFYGWCQDSGMFPDSAPVGERLSSVKRTLTHSVLHGYSIDREPTHVPGDAMTLLSDLRPPQKLANSQLWTAHVSWHAWNDGPDEIDGEEILIQATQTNEAPMNLTPVPVGYYEDFSRHIGVHEE
jgi:hypothetical protein